MDAQHDARLSTVAAACPPIDPMIAEAGESARLSMHQLQLAVADISKAMNEALRVDCTSAVLYLRRAENFLRSGVRPETSRTVAPGPRLTAWQRRKVLEHIESRLSQPLRNRELAALVDYSEFHFNVAFRNSLGKAPHEFLICRRIERAQQLMLSTRMPLCDIAADCGLADQAHLTRLFRRVVGETPAAWRKIRLTGASVTPDAVACRAATKSN